MDIRETSLPDVLCLTPRRFGDERGRFSESWSARHMAAAGLVFDWVQDNHSHSAERRTVRGLHFQAPPSAQTKLVRVVRGRILDVAVDIRRDSPSYGRWIVEELSTENGAPLLVPKGFLHGFVTLEPATDVLYKADAFYDPGAAVLSEKDAAAPAFAEFESPFAHGDPD